jgi:hypothetical protein
MTADKSLFSAGQPPDNGGMTRIKPPAVTLAQWLAVAAIWGVATYGALVGKPAEATADRVHLIACRP